jgi:hemerythrin-like metal-binding protein
MAFYNWTESMSVGVRLLDADHKALIALINRLHDGLETGREPSDLNRIFDELIAYIEFHFAREEKVMEVSGYPGVVSHREEHGEFTHHVYGIKERYETSPGLAITVELLDYLKNWLNHHILIQDMAYRPFAEQSARANEAAEGFGSGLVDSDSPTPD